VAEAATGAALLLAPGITASLHLGATFNESAATLVARMCGAALIVVGIACWSARDDARLDRAVLKSINIRPDLAIRSRASSFETYSEKESDP
jgi:hypothetical protein